MPPRITWEQVRAWRMARQSLVRKSPRDRMLDVVRDVCGVHAQVTSSAELQVWARVKGATPADVRDALWDHRTLVRTWLMRGTLHILTSQDLPLYVSALSQHDRWWKGAWLRMIEMNAEELRATLDAIRESLGAKPLTREQLADKVARRTGTRESARMLSGWGEMLKPAAFQGHLCSGPPRGQSVTFVRPDRWLGKWDVPDPRRAWREIVRRYLHTYGPASREEFARWWGMQPAPAGRVLGASADELTEVDVEGHRAWLLRDDLPQLRRARRSSAVRLVPGFDVYTAGSRPHASLVADRHKHLVFRKAGWISPVVLVGGMALGVWKHARTGRGVEITVQAFGRLGADQRRAIATEADGIGRFLNAPATVSYA
jgi:Winged helix DNA-binding domain